MWQLLQRGSVSLCCGGASPSEIGVFLLVDEIAADPEDDREDHESEQEEREHGTDDRILPVGDEVRDDLHGLPLRDGEGVVIAHHQEKRDVPDKAGEDADEPV